MGIFSYGKKGKEDIKSKAEMEKQTAKDWLPIKDVRDGIVVLKNGEYIKILEVLPINFKLKSKEERRILIYNYRAFLKACRFPMQISIQCRKADVEPHINRMKRFYDVEKNDNVRTMIKGYINLVQQIGSKTAITRRYFVVFPYIVPPGIKNFEFNDVRKQLYEKQIQIKEFLNKCGNEVAEANDTEFTVDVLYSYLNKRTSEVQKLGKRLVSLMGTYLEAVEEEHE